MPEPLSLTIIWSIPPFLISTVILVDFASMALSSNSLTIEKGDIYGILGLSGAGKSTLVRCINGLETFDEGEILFNGDFNKIIILISNDGINYKDYTFNN